MTNCVPYFLVWLTLTEQTTVRDGTFRSGPSGAGAFLHLGAPSEDLHALIVRVAPRGRNVSIV